MKRNDAWWFVAFVLFLFALLSLLGLMLRVVMIVLAVLVYRVGWLFWVIGIWLNNRAATVRERQGMNRSSSTPALAATETFARSFLRFGRAAARLGCFIGALVGFEVDSARMTDAENGGSVAGRLIPTGGYGIEVAGCRYYQTALEGVCQGDDAQSQGSKVQATLIPDDGNPHDGKAVRVEVQGLLVGHLTRINARQYRKRLRQMGVGPVELNCDAMVVRQGDGSLGVFLDLPTTE